MTDDEGEHVGDRRRDEPGRRSSDVEHALLLSRLEAVEDELDAIRDSHKWFRRTVITAACGAGSALLVSTMVR